MLGFKCIGVLPNYVLCLESSLNLYLTKWIQWLWSSLCYYHWNRGELMDGS